MDKRNIKECPRCGQPVSFWSNRRMCVDCRAAELHTPEHKAKAKVWRLVNEAVQAGRLTRRPCEVCGAVKSDAHHDDYAKALSVRWLCRTHHKQFHQQEAAS